MNKSEIPGSHPKSANPYASEAIGSRVQGALHRSRVRRLAIKEGSLPTGAVPLSEGTAQPYIRREEYSRNETPPGAGKCRCEGNVRLPLSRMCGPSFGVSRSLSWCSGLKFHAAIDAGFSVLQFRIPGTKHDAAIPCADVIATVTRQVARYGSLEGVCSQARAEDRLTLLRPALHPGVRIRLRKWGVCFRLFRQCGGTRYPSRRSHQEPALSVVPRGTHRIGREAQLVGLDPFPAFRLDGRGWLYGSQKEGVCTELRRGSQQYYCS